MVTTSDGTTHAAIATKLADMKALQRLLISGAEALRSQCADSTIQDLFIQVQEHEEDILESLNRAIAEFNPPGEATETIHASIEKIQQALQNPNLSLVDKVLQYTLLKYQQIFMGLMVHEAAAALGGTTAKAMRSLNEFSFELEIHQEELKTILETLAVHEMTGKEMPHGFWHLLQNSWLGW
jgi:hypothetical protein